MKTIIIHSGKGGVGKSTITSMIGVELAAAGHKVALIDGDINTPSLHIIFPESQAVNLNVFSPGFSGAMSSFFMGISAGDILKSLAKKAKEMKPDIVLIDTPPSFFSVHAELIKHFNISGVIIVTEPSKLSATDVKRTMTAFHLQEIPILGVVLNKCKNPGGAISLNVSTINAQVLCEIAFDEKYNTLVEECKFPAARFPEISPAVQTVNDSQEIDWKEYKKDIEFDVISREEIEFAYEEIMHDPGKVKKFLRFYNLETWEFIREKLEDAEFYWRGTLDNFLILNDDGTIKRLLGPFEESEIALFIVIRTTNTDVPLFRGEIGYGRLILNEESYYSVPRILYYAGDGEVTLFPHEVSPTNINYVTEMIESGEMVVHPKYENRYLPTPDTIQQIDAQFGGVHSGWRDYYQEVGIKCEFMQEG